MFVYTRHSFFFKCCDIFLHYLLSLQNFVMVTYILGHPVSYLKIFLQMSLGLMFKNLSPTSEFSRQLLSIFNLHLFKTDQSDACELSQTWELKGLKLSVQGPQPQLANWFIQC